ncbi:tripartite tricarboxylate transporter substrate-binding protein, partial [Bradyrhizobium sp. UFLA01-814]|uniref:IS66 family insertion sequence element accessory protein TnpA n=1 Tax=Bradyrhizobium sp. UFLA01-814 TaxID=3023480 RepID=UPI00398BA06C
MGTEYFKNEARRSFWSVHVEAWRRSGLSKRKYCRQHRLSGGTFDRWLRHLIDAEAMKIRTELRREERRERLREKRAPVSKDLRCRAVQAFWAMHVEAMRWCGLSMQAYPARPVRMIVPFAPAGTMDISARLIGQWLSERLGQQFVIENRAGANGNIGTESALKAGPDGYTLLMVDASPTINATLYEKLTFNFVRDAAPVATVARVPFILVVHPSVPAKTLPEFIAYAKANPGKINYGSAGRGNTLHVAAELFKMLAGVDLVHVPYKGGVPLLRMLS